jgi:hypothetical protein
MKTTLDDNNIRALVMILQLFFALPSLDIQADLFMVIRSHVPAFKKFNKMHDRHLEYMRPLSLPSRVTPNKAFLETIRHQLSCDLSSQLVQDLFSNYPSSS